MTRSDPKVSRRAWQWSSLGILILVADLVLLYVIRFVLDIDNFFVREILSKVMPSLVILCFYRARRYMARVDLDAAAGQPATEDTRPPVVYLRSFDVDDKEGSTISLMRAQTQEEMLADTFNEAGPFLAIGKPSEKLPTLGAARLYVEDNKWEETVTDLMSRARLVVLRAGETEGLLWEVRRAAATLPPEKLLLLIPYGRRSYEAFRRKAQPFFPRPLPDYPTWKFFVSLRGFIYFDSDWEARFIPFKPDLLRGKWTDPSCSWRMGLRPFYERLGIPWVPPRVNWARNTFSAFLVCMILWGISERIREHYHLPTPGEAAYLQFVKRVEATPEFTLSLPHSVDVEPYTWARILTTRGLHRLSDESLLRYVSLHRKLLMLMDEKRCALVAWGIASPRDIGESLDKLTPAESESWLSLSEEAALRELKNAPAAHPLDGLSLAEARGHLLQGIPKKEAQLFRSGRLSSRETGAKETCQIARTLFTKADESDHRIRPLLAHAVIAMFY